MKQVIVARRDLDLDAGKLAAQVAHAALTAADRADENVRRQWREAGQKKVVLRAATERDVHELAEEARRAGLPHAVIRDAGHTVLEPGTVTTLGIGPASPEAIDRITGDLSLY